jgi:hypothetical protein
MTEQATPENDAETTASRSDRLAARRRRTRVSVALVAVLALGAGAVIAAYQYAGEKSAPAATPLPAEKLAVGDALPAVQKAATTHPPRALDHTHPLRLWIGGDSLAGSFGPSLGDLLGATGVVKTTIDYKVSSGLWSNDIRDWYSRATDQMKSDDPEAVVYIIGTNDAPVVNSVDANHDGEPDWETAYRLKVDRMMDLFVGDPRAPRTVFWLGAPTLGTKSMNRGAQQIDQLVSAEALKRGTNVVFLDTYRLFSGPDGGYSRDIVDDQGKTIEARISDGVHFTADGAAYLARAVFALLDARWHIKQQADTSQPMGWTFASGDGETVPGYNYVPQSRYRTWHPSPTTYESVQTTPSTVASAPTPTSVPATSPPATSPPATSPPATTGSPPTSTKPSKPPKP